MSAMSANSNLPDLPELPKLDLDLTGFFAAFEPIDPATRMDAISPQQEKKLSEEAVIGESKLTSNGFFVRINEAAPRRKPRNTPPTVLVIEDDDTTATLILSALEQNGYKV